MNYEYINRILGVFLCYKIYPFYAVLLQFRSFFIGSAAKGGWGDHVFILELYNIKFNCLNIEIKTKICFSMISLHNFFCI